MIKMLAAAFYIALMAGLYFLCRWLIFGVSEHFGEGVFVGVMLMVVLLYVTWKLAPESFIDRRHRGE